jgi:hypothetical protein
LQHIRYEKQEKRGRQRSGDAVRDKYDEQAPKCHIGKDLPQAGQQGLTDGRHRLADADPAEGGCRSNQQ